MPNARSKRKKKTTRQKTTVRQSAAPRGGNLTGASVRAIRAELDRRIKSLEKKRASLERELASVEAEIARHVYNGQVPSAGRPTGKRPRNARNLVESLHKLLKRRTLSVTEMAIAVQEAGYRTTSPNFRTIVNQTLINNPDRFRRVSRGRYTAC